MGRLTIYTDEMHGMGPSVLLQSGTLERSLKDTVCRQSTAWRPGRPLIPSLEDESTFYNGPMVMQEW